MPRLDPVCLVCSHGFCLFIMLAGWGVVLKRAAFLGLQFTPLSLPSQVSHPWLFLLSGVSSVFRRRVAPADGLALSSMVPGGP